MGWGGVITLNVTVRRLSSALEGGAYYELGVLKAGRFVILHIFLKLD